LLLSPLLLFILFTTFNQLVMHYIEYPAPPAPILDVPTAVTSDATTPVFETKFESAELPL